jgi:hypothetical protein
MENGLSKVTLTQKQVDEDPTLVWNTFIDIIASGADSSLTPFQHHCHFCFHYDSEVLNGGHLQFFENNGIEYAKCVLVSLGELGLVAASKILREALSVAVKHDWPRFRSLSQYVDGAREGEFDVLDNSYYELEPSVSHSLESILEHQQDEFIEIVP